MKRLLAYLTATLVLAVSFWVSPMAAETALAAPAAPTGFMVTAYSASRINLSWNAVSGATSYQVYRSTGASTTYTRIAIVTTRSYQNTGLAAATRYNYKVRAVKSGVLGSFTAVKTAYTKPATPTGLTATAISTSQIKLKWTAVTGATSYQVYRSYGASTSYTRIAIVTAPAYSNTGLAAGARYNYKVRAVKSGNIGDFTAAKTAYTKPTIPTGLAAKTISASQIDLSWTAVTGATSYQVYRSTGSSTGYTRIAIVTAPAYSNRSLAAGTRYNYKVCAVKSGSIGGFTAVKTAYTKPVAPAGLTAAAQGTGSIKLTWAAVAGAAKYIVYRSASATGTFAKVGEATTATYTNTGLAANTTYYYKVSAANAGGASALSAAASAKTLLAKPATPTGLTATAQSSSSIKLTWTAVAGAAKYIVYRSASATGTFAKVGEATTATYTNTGLAANTTYYYKVSAANAGGASALSAAASAKTLAATLPAPTGLKATTASTSQINLTWNAVSGATQYQVYRSVGASTAYSLVRTQSTTSFNNIGLTPGVKYNYRVKALAGSASSAYSATASAYTKPLAPINVAAARASDTKIHLTWSKPSECTGYKVYVSVNGGGYTYLATVTEPTRQYDHAGLAAGTYQYRITAVAGTIESAPVTTAALAMPDPRLPAPTWVSATAVDYDSINLKWNSVAGAVKYNIYMSTNASSGYSLLGEWVGTECNANDLNPNTAYYFKLSAVDVNGREGDKSVSIGETTDPAPPKPGTPTYYVASIADNGNGTMRVTFNESGYVSRTSLKFYYSTDGTNWTLDATTPDGQIYWFYLDRPQGSTLWVKFVAYNGITAGDPRIYNLAVIPNPTGLAYKTRLFGEFNPGVTTGCLDVRWNHTPGAAGYDVYVAYGYGDGSYSELSYVGYVNDTGSGLQYATLSKTGAGANMLCSATYNIVIVPYNSQGYISPYKRYFYFSILGTNTWVPVGN